MDEQELNSHLSEIFEEEREQFKERFGDPDKEFPATDYQPCGKLYLPRGWTVIRKLRYNEENHG